MKPNPIYAKNLKASLLLAPATAVLLGWIGCFSGLQTIQRIGQLAFWIVTIVTSVTISYLITLYLSYLAELNANR